MDLGHGGDRRGHCRDHRRRHAGHRAAPGGRRGPAAADDHADDTPQLVTVYFVGDTGAGPRLFAERREFGGRDVLRWSLSNVVAGNAQDSDYISRWPKGAAVAGRGCGTAC